MPSCQICLSESDCLALLKNINIISAAIANLAKTNTATTPLVPREDFSASKESSACFIQIKVAPQTNVTASKAIMAILRCSGVALSSKLSKTATVWPSDIIFPPISSAL